MLIFLVIVGLQDLPCVVKWFWPETKPDKEESEEEKEKDAMEDADDDDDEEDEPEVCRKKISVSFYYVFHCQEGLLSIFRLFYLANSVTTLFKNRRTLKFKSQLTFAFFSAVKHLRGPLRKQNFT